RTPAVEAKRFCPLREVQTGGKARRRLACLPCGGGGALRASACAFLCGRGALQPLFGRNFLRGGGRARRERAPAPAFPRSARRERRLSRRLCGRPAQSLSRARPFYREGGGHGELLLLFPPA